MKRLVTILQLAIFISCSVSFHTDEDGLCESVFSIRRETRGTGASDNAESNIQYWAVMLFDTGNPQAWYYASSEDSSDITCTVRKGRPYRAYAIVNYPREGNGLFSPSLVESESQLLDYSSSLSSNAPDALIMFGTKNLPQLPSGITEIPLYRLCSKVAIAKISVRMDDPVYSAQEFTLKAIYLTNVYTMASYAGDHPVPSADPLCWYNAKDWHGSGNLRTLDILTGDRGLNVTIPNGGSYETLHTYYAYPNAAEEDTDQDDWAPRHTRLVIEATLGGKRYYYPITLPTMKRNNCYTVTEAIIRKPGSLDPEKNIPGVLDTSITITEDTWDSEYHINEAS